MQSYTSITILCLLSASHNCTFVVPRQLQFLCVFRWVSTERQALKSVIVWSTADHIVPAKIIYAEFT